MLNTKRLVVCRSFRTISNTSINIYRSERSHSLTSVKRKGDPPVCTMRQLAQTSFSESTKASSKADRGMTVLYFTGGKNPFLILNDNKEKKLILYQNIVLPVQNLGWHLPPPCLTLATALNVDSFYSVASTWCFMNVQHQVEANTVKTGVVVVVSGNYKCETRQSVPYLLLCELSLSVFFFSVKLCVDLFF